MTKNIYFDKSQLKDGFALISKNERFSNEYMFMGTKLKDFYFDRPGKARTPSWIKQLIFVLSFYLDTKRTKAGGIEHQDFFMSTSTVRKIISNYSSHEYCMRTIEKNWNKLETYGFVNVIPNTIKKVDSSDKRNYHRRIIELNIDYINKLLSVYSKDDPIYKDLGKRSIIKKFIKARPISYIGNKNEAVIAKFKEYLKAGIATNSGYSNATDMVYKFADEVTSKYQSIAKLKNIYTPKFLVSQEEEVNRRVDALPRALTELTDDDIGYLESLSKKNPKMLQFEASQLINRFKVNALDTVRLIDIGFKVSTESRIIVAFSPGKIVENKARDSNTINVSERGKELLRAFNDAIR